MKERQGAERKAGSRDEAKIKAKIKIKAEHLACRNPWLVQVCNLYPRTGQHTAPLITPNSLLVTRERLSQIDEIDQRTAPSFINRKGLSIGSVAARKLNPDRFSKPVRVGNATTDATSHGMAPLTTPNSLLVTRERLTKIDEIDQRTAPTITTTTTMTTLTTTTNEAIDHRMAPLSTLYLRLSTSNSSAPTKHDEHLTYSYPLRNLAEHTHTKKSGGNTSEEVPLRTPFSCLEDDLQRYPSNQNLSVDRYPLTQHFGSFTGTGMPFRLTNERITIYE